MHLNQETKFSPSKKTTFPCKNIPFIDVFPIETK